MSKIKKSELLDIVREQGSAITNLLQRVTLLEKPQLKQLDQSVFNNMHERWKFAAVDADGRAHRFNKLVDVFRSEFVYEGDDYNEFKFSLIGAGYDTSNWQNSLIERGDIAKELIGSELTRKMLTDGADKVNCYVGDDSDYDALSDKVERTVVGFSDGWFHTNSAASWKYAVPVPKEKELTGSNLCRAMLERGDKYVMCLVSDSSEHVAIQNETPGIATGTNNKDLFTTTSINAWIYVVPINNQGEPLTARDVGL